MTTQPIDRVLDALMEHNCQPKRSGDGWAFRSPLRDDRNPSCTMSVGDDGRVLLSDHGGGTAQEIVAALGLKMSDLFPSNGKAPPRKPARPKASPKPKSDPMPTIEAALDVMQKSLGKPWRTWTYTDADGTERGAVSRWGEPGQLKEIRQLRRDADGWRWSAMDEPRPLYNLRKIAAADPGEAVYVVEGERTADAMAACGFVVTTSCGGAKAANKSDWSPLSGRRVVVVPDRDDDGLKYAEDVAGLAIRAGAVDVRVVRLWEKWPKLPGDGGDAADLIDDMGIDGVDLHDAVRQLAAEAEPVKPKPMPGDPVLIDLAGVKPEPVRWLWRGRIPLGRMSLVVGDPGRGKSMATLDMAARVSRGADWFDGSPCERGGVLLICAEDDPADTVVPRLQAAGADLSRIKALGGVHTTNAKGEPAQACFDLSDIDALGQAMAAVPGLRMVVIDPIGSYLGGGVNSYKDNEVRSVLAPVAALAAEFDAALVVVCHTRKGASAFADDMVMGSRAFTGLARAVHHVFADPDDKGGDTRLFLPGKCNLARKPMGLVFRIDQTTVDGVPEPVPKVLWTGTTDQTADEVARAAADGGGGGDRGPGPAVRHGMDFLAAELADGPVAVGDLRKAAKESGIGWRSVETAKAEMGVESRKMPDGWVWELPASNPASVLA